MTCSILHVEHNSCYFVHNTTERNSFGSHIFDVHFLFVLPKLAISCMHHWSRKAVVYRMSFSYTVVRKVNICHAHFCHGEFYTSTTTMFVCDFLGI